MIPEIRKKFNADFSEKIYQEFLDDLEFCTQVSNRFSCL